MQYHYRIIDEKEVYRGFFTLRRYQVQFDYFSGGESGAVMRECAVSSGGVVAALPYDSARDEFVLVEQFRIGPMVAGITPWTLELVAGLRDKDDESPEACIQRELSEEIGTPAQRLELLHQYFSSPGSGSGQTRLYLAEIDATRTVNFAGLHEEGEDILVHRIARTQLIEKLVRGEINNATLLIAVQAFLLRSQLSKSL